MDKHQKLHAYELKQSLHGYSREDLEELWKEAQKEAIKEIRKHVKSNIQPATSPDPTELRIAYNNALKHTINYLDMKNYE